MNKKLFHLGNDVVLIRQEIDRLKCSGTFSIPALLILEDMLELINQIRMEVAYEYEQKEDKTFDVKIPCCSSPRLKQVMELLNDEKITYEVEEKK